MTNQIVISRIQNRRGIKENLPQPLLPGEFALTIDTGELWIGTDPAQPPWGVRTYGSGSGDITAAESIVDTEIVSAKFTSAFLTTTTFESLKSFLISSVVVELVDIDILWDSVDAVFVAADLSVDVSNTVSNIISEIDVWDTGNERDVVAFNTLGAINTPATDPTTTSAFDPINGDFLFVIAGSNAKQGSNAASLINQIHGTQLVTTLANLQVTTSGIGVGTSTFRDHTVTDTDSGYAWANIGTASADSTTDVLTWVSGEGIDLQIDTTLDAIRITNTIDSVAAAPFTLTASTPAFTSISGLSFDMEAPGSNISDVIILEYSINIGGATPGSNNYTAIGTMRIVGNILVGTGEATLQDDQTEVRDAALVGDVNFQALFSAGTGTGGADEIVIQFTNTFTSNVSLRVLKRRWSSF